MAKSNFSMDTFLKLYAQTGSAREVCKRMKSSYKTLYRWLNRDEKFRKQYNSIRKEFGDGHRNNAEKVEDNFNKATNILMDCEKFQKKPATFFTSYHISNRTFWNTIRKHKELQNIIDNINWYVIYGLYCQECGALIDDSNYKKFEKSKLKPPEVCARLPKLCDNCRKHRNNDRNYQTFELALGTLFRACRSRNKQQWHIGTDFDKQYLYKLLKEQNYRCYYTNYEMAHDKGSLFKVSVDRVDSTKPYQKDNIVLCCWFVNRAKMDVNIEQFVDMCRKVIDKYDKS